MMTTRLRVMIAAALLLFAAGGAGMYFQYKKISGYITEQLSGQAAKKLGRQIKVDKVSFSLLDGITLENACVSRRPDFSKGNFFCAERTVIRPQFSAFIRNKVYFSSISFVKPRLSVREDNGVWDFADLLALIPDTDKGLYLTWNTSELSMTGAVLEADLHSTGLSLALEDTSLKLEHFSTLGGNYGLKAAGRLQTAVKDKLLTSDIKLDAEANFDYGGLASTKGTFEAADVSYGAITLASLKSDWSLFNMRKALAEKNYSFDLSAENLLVPAQENSMRDSVTEYLQMFSSAMGKPAPRIEDIEMASLKGSFRLDDNKLAVKDLALRTNFMDLDGKLELDGPAKTAEAGLNLNIGSNKIELAASGPMAEPVIKPALSITLSSKLKEALAGLEKSLLARFPVTGE